MMAFSQIYLFIRDILTIVLVINLYGFLSLISSYFIHFHDSNPVGWGQDCTDYILIKIPSQNNQSVCRKYVYDLTLMQTEPTSIFYSHANFFFFVQIGFVSTFLPLVQTGYMHTFLTHVQTRLLSIFFTLVQKQTNLIF